MLLFNVRIYWINKIIKIKLKKCPPFPQNRYRIYSTKDHAGQIMGNFFRPRGISG